MCYYLASIIRHYPNRKKEGVAKNSEWGKLWYSMSMVLPRNRFKDGKWYEDGFVAYDVNYMTHHHFLDPTTEIHPYTGEEVELPNVFSHGVGYGSTKEEALNDLNYRMSLPCPA